MLLLIAPMTTTAIAWSSEVTTSTFRAPAGGDPGTIPLPGSNVPKTAYDKRAPIVPMTRDSTRNTTKKVRKFLDHTSNMPPRMLPTVAPRGNGVGAYGDGEGYACGKPGDGFCAAAGAPGGGDAG